MTEKKWIDGGNPCDDAFIDRFPDFSYEGSTALTIWRMAWDLSKEIAEDEKPRIQLI
jgi:hypothetical protein